MNAGDGSVEPKIDLGLSLNNQCNQLVNDSGAGAGAGANAASRIEMAFVSSDPLSELVWSPHQGLRLKCTDRSFTDQRLSLFWGLGPGNMVNVPSESINIPETNSEKSIDKSKPQDTVGAKRDFGANSSFTKYSARNARTHPLSIHEPSEVVSNNVRETSTAVEAIVRVIAKEERDRKDCKMKDTDFPISDSSRPNFADIVPRPEDCGVVTSFGPNNRGKEINDLEQIMRLEIGMASEHDCMKQSKFCGGSPPNPASSTAKYADLALIVGDQGRSTEKPLGSCRASLEKNDAPLEKHESSAENDVQAVVYEIVDSESNNDIKNLCQEGERDGPGGKNLVVEQSPANSQILLRQRKGKKRKALSDADVDTKLSEREDNSHESVESCNSAGYFSSGKRRWNLEEQFITGSKRFKKQMQEGPESTSVVGQRSSFMNWISNMVKGFSKSYQDDTPSLALGLGHSNPGYDTLESKLVKHGESGDHCKSTGFQSIFRSLYSPISKGLETSVNTEGLQDFNENELGKQVIDVNVSPISCHLPTDNSFQQYSQSNDKDKQYKSVNDASASAQAKILSVHVSAQENEKLNKEKNISCNLVSRTEMCQVSPSCSPLDKYKTVSGENNDSDLPSKRKATPSSCLRSDPLGSLWVTRFCSRSPVPLSCHFTQSTSEADCASPQPLNCIGSFKDKRCMEAKDISPERSSSIKKNSDTVLEFSSGLKRHSEPNDLNCENRRNSTLSSQRFREPDAMVSTFARRLDALKQIMPSDASLNINCAAITCFFCGLRGHNLPECSEIPKTELDNLLQNWNSNGSDVSPSLCVKCFQLNHQAAECPNASSRRSKSGKKTEQTTENEDIPSEVPGSDSIRDGKGSEEGSDLRLPQKLHKMLVSKERVLNSELAGHDITPNPGKIEATRNHDAPLENLLDEKITYLPKGFSDAIKGLRLSRTDILKWRDSHRSLSHLDGFFVRLRVGKWEKGQGGTGYHVACIDGAECGDSLPHQSSKSSISVSINGVKCIIHSQYISNHDFLEDELMTWCTATIRSGRKIPSAEDLSSKRQRRTKLGF